MNSVYLDYHSTTPVDERVQLVLNDLMRDCFGNSQNVTHDYGRVALENLAIGTEQIAALIGAHARELVFTSGATEANNMAVLGTARATGHGHIIVSAADHRSVLGPVEALAEEGFSVSILHVDQYGAVSIDELVAQLREDTFLVSVIFANNEVGTFNPISEIGAICRDRQILFHTDATQAVGKTAIDLSSSNIDLMSFSAHKIYGPKGVGALYVNRETVGPRLKPIMYGGHHQGLRPGTAPIPIIAGFGKACELCAELLDEDGRRVAEMRDRLWHRFQQEIPDIVLNGHPNHRLCNNLNVSFLGVPSEAFIIRLRDSVAISVGSACTSSNPEPSHVLRAMGIYGDRLESAIRFGLGRFNTMSEIDHVADQVRDAVAILRNV